jgi:hypothetical protein
MQAALMYAALFELTMQHHVDDQDWVDSVCRFCDYAGEEAEQCTCAILPSRNSSRVPSP